MKLETILKFTALISTGYLIGWLLSGELYEAPKINGVEIQPYAVGALAPIYSDTLSPHDTTTYRR